jgi:hypothetical protein
MWVLAIGIHQVALHGACWLYFELQTFLGTRWVQNWRLEARKQAHGPAPAAMQFGSLAVMLHHQRHYLAPQLDSRTPRLAIRQACGGGAGPAGARALSELVAAWCSHKLVSEAVWRSYRAEPLMIGLSMCSVWCGMLLQDP